MEGRVVQLDSPLFEIFNSNRHDPFTIRAMLLGLPSQVGIDEGAVIIADGLPSTDVAHCEEATTCQWVVDS